MSLLVVDDLSVRHGVLLALDGVRLRVETGQIVGLIGPNGAGKTTFIDTLTGFTRSLHGRIIFDGHDITAAPPHIRSRSGLVRTFQSLELFDDMSVLDNLMVSSRSASLWSTLADALRPRAHDASGAHAVLDLLDLWPVAHRLPTELSNGQRHMVALGRALAGSPRLVLLDEPAAGLDPAETMELAATLRRLPEIGTTVLVVDHDMSLIMNVCDTVHVLDFGKVVASGPPARVRHNPKVIAAYLGRPPTQGGQS